MNSDLLTQVIVWIAMVSYSLAALLYLYVIYELTDPYLQSIHVMIVLGFLILAYQTYKKAKQLQQDPNRIKDPAFLFNKWTQMGWGFIAFFFILLYIPEDISLHLHWYFPIAFLAYFNLYIGHYIGVFLLILFYIISIVSHIPYSWFSYISHFTKIGILLYMSLYAYHYIYWYKTYQTPLI